MNQSQITQNIDSQNNNFQQTHLALFGHSSLYNNIEDFLAYFRKYPETSTNNPLFVLGDSLDILKRLPDESIDCCMTSPPYWGKREYHSGGIGLEKNFQNYLQNLSLVFLEVKRVLKQSGSFWLNMGDSYYQKKLLGLPWRIAITLSDEQGWILRNSVIWNKVKGGLDNTTDRLRNIHENVFHFVKIPKGYYYDIDTIRKQPRQAKIANGAVVSATGVTGINYKRKIELSTELSAQEKSKAYASLEQIMQEIANGKISDFRMIIRGQQRTTHSNSKKISGRAKELQEKGFYFIKYHPKGAKPSDVWDILPEDSQQRKIHFAPYPIDLCKIPIAATCPPNGIVLDPFCGTGTTMVTAQLLGRKSLGIDICKEYLQLAQSRSDLFYE